MDSDSEMSDASGRIDPDFSSDDANTTGDECGDTCEDSLEVLPSTSGSASTAPAESIPGPVKKRGLSSV